MIATLLVDRTLPADAAAGFPTLQGLGGNDAIGVAAVPRHQLVWSNEGGDPATGRPSNNGQAEDVDQIDLMHRDAPSLKGGLASSWAAGPLQSANWSNGQREGAGFNHRRCELHTLVMYAVFGVCLVGAYSKFRSLRGAPRAAVVVPTEPLVVSCPCGRLQTTMPTKDQWSESVSGRPSAPARELSGKGEDAKAAARIVPVWTSNSSYTDTAPSSILQQLRASPLLPSTRATLPAPLLASGVWQVQNV